MSYPYLQRYKFCDEDFGNFLGALERMMYQLGSKNIIPSWWKSLVGWSKDNRGNEAVPWHRRLGQCQLQKIINKLVKAIWLGLPSKTFKLDHSGVIMEQIQESTMNILCKKGNQEKNIACQGHHIKMVFAERKNRLLLKLVELYHLGKFDGKKSKREKGPDYDVDLDLLTPSMNFNSSQPMHPEERTAAKEVSLSSEEQALHDELVI
ncbi:hypothetical protein Tco_1313643 [Tanacetum coccineum]